MVTMMVPFSMEDTVGIQGWLQGLARQGLIMESGNNGTFTFKRGEPIPLRYRIDPTKGHPISGPPQAMKDLYAEYGWEYVDSYNRFAHVFVTDDPDAPEPFHSPEALAQATRSAARRRILYWSGGLLFYALVAFSLWSRKKLDAYAGFHLLLMATGVSSMIYHIRTALNQEEKIKTPGILDQPTAPSRLFKGSFVLTMVLLGAYLLYHIFR